MIVRIEVSAYCDGTGCTAWLHARKSETGGVTVAAALTSLTDKGWLVDGERTYCPACSAKRKEGKT